MTISNYLVKILHISIICLAIGLASNTHAQDFASSKEKLSFQILNQLKQKGELSDPFDLLTEQELEREWSLETEESLLSKIDKLKHTFQEHIYVDVRLVGFHAREKADGHRNWISNLNQKNFTNFLEELVYDPYVTVMKPLSGDNHNLYITKKFLFQVSNADKSLTTKLENAINSNLNRGVYSISYRVVDDILKKEYEESHDQAYTIYLLNLQLNEQGVHLYIANNNQETNNYCPSPLGVGEDRYAWLDLSTKTTQYGPEILGDGVAVTESTIPSVNHYIRKMGMSQISKKAKEGFGQSLIVEIISFVRRTCEYLISPSLAYFPVPYYPSTVFHIITISDQPNTTRSSQENEFNANLIEQTLRSIPLLPEQSINVVTEHLHLGSCLHCAAVVTYATKYAVASPDGAITTSYLDSAELHRWLNHFRGDFLKDSGNSRASNTLIVPVFLFDFVSDMALLDRTHQSLSFPDMIISMQNRRENSILNQKCNHVPVQINTRDATRPTLASILQTAYGIAPTYRRWSSIHNKTIENHLWSAGETPFGPLSPTTQLSFSQKDAAARHPLYTQIHYILEEVNGLLTHFSDYDKEVSEVLSPSDHLQFVRRWNLFRYKVEEARRFLSHNHYEQCFHFVRSLHFDVTALHRLIHLAGRSLQVTFTCDDGNASSPGDSLQMVKKVVALSPIVLILWVVGSMLLGMKKKNSVKKRV